MQSHKQHEDEQWIFEISILSKIDLGTFDDNLLVKYIQESFNEKYGVSYDCRGNETPNVHCRTTSVKFARYVMEEHRQRKLFWQKEFTDNLIEQQWIRDIAYFENLQMRQGRFDWSYYTPLQWKQFVDTKRLADPGTIVDDAYVFMVNEDAYEFFRHKVRDRIVPTKKFQCEKCGKCVRDQKTLENHTRRPAGCRPTDTYHQSVYVAACNP